MTFGEKVQGVKEFTEGYIDSIIASIDRNGGDFINPMETPHNHDVANNIDDLFSLLELD